MKRVWVELTSTDGRKLMFQVGKITAIKEGDGKLQAPTYIETVAGGSVDEDLWAIREPYEKVIEKISRAEWATGEGHGV